MADNRTSDIVVDLDHVTTVLPDRPARQLFSALGRLGLFVAWPYADYGPLWTGGIRLGNLNLEVIGVAAETGGGHAGSGGAGSEEAGAAEAGAAEAGATEAGSEEAGSGEARSAERGAAPAGAGVAGKAGPVQRGTGEAGPGEPAAGGPGEAAAGGPGTGEAGTAGAGTGGAGTAGAGTGEAGTGGAGTGPWPRQVLTLAPASLAGLAEELDQRGVRHGDPAPFPPLPDGESLCTTMDLPELSGDTLAVQFCAYPGGPRTQTVAPRDLAGVQHVERVVLGSSDIGAARERWAALLAPEGPAEGQADDRPVVVWQPGYGPALELRPAAADAVLELVLRVRSLPVARAAFTAAGLSVSGDAVTLGTLSARLVSG